MLDILDITTTYIAQPVYKYSSNPNGIFFLSSFLYDYCDPCLIQIFKFKFIFFLNFNRGMVKGMGIPKGITVIAGGGFHGYEKDLLLVLSINFTYVAILFYTFVSLTVI